MYSSGDASVKFRITKPMISDVIDIFGMDVRFANETDTHVDVYARVTEEAMFQFAKNYSPLVKIISPKKLVDRMKNEIEEMKKLYE